MFYRYKFRTEEINNELILRPKIPIMVSHKDKSQVIFAVLDTGSDLVYLPRDLAEYFELPISEEIFTAKGVEHQFAYQQSNIKIKLEHPHKPFQKKLNVIIPTSKQYSEVILGTEFLHHFAALFDYPNKSIKLTEHG